MAVNMMYTPSLDVDWGDIPKLDTDVEHLKEFEKTPLINQILFDTELEPIQLQLVEQIIRNGGGILSAEMGIGKTYIGVALARYMRLLYPDKKVIITAPTNVVKNFKTLIDTALGEIAMVCNGEYHRVELFKKVFKDINIFIVTHSFWLNSDESLKFLYNHIEDFSFTFYDEADSKDAIGFDVYTEFSRRVPLKVVSNATPIGKDTGLVRNLLYAVNATNMSKSKFRSKYVDFKYVGGNLQSERVKINDIYRDFNNYFINKNRTDLGLEVDITTKFHKVFINNTQREWIKREMRKDLAMYCPENKSVVDNIENYDGCPYPEINKDNIPAFAEVLKILIDSSNEKIIIYARNVMSLEKLANISMMMGYTPYVINGSSSSESKTLSEQYNNDPKGIAITNIFKGINLGSTEKIILYGTPPDVMQTLYRSIRGRESKSISVNWIYYPEFEYNILIDTQNHIQNIDKVTKRETELLTSLDEEIQSLQRYNFVPMNLYSHNKYTNTGFRNLSFEDRMNGL